jgi:hypothetical protein
MPAVQDPPPQTTQDRAAPPPPPEMRVTRYDRVSSFLLALVTGLALIVFCVVTFWWANRPPPPQDLVPLEMLEVSGGFEDGNPEDTWELESPDPETPDASLVEEETEDVSVEEVLDNVVELSDQATQQFEQVAGEAARNQGKLGSASGSGGRPLGMGPGMGGVPRDQRWFIRFAEGRSIDEYAKQLDFFGIELGVLQPTGELMYVSGFSGAPQKRVVQTGKDEQRLYMTWQSGERQKSDAQLLRKAGIEVTGRSVVFHFYPRETEQLLAKLEFDYRKKQPQEIRRTFFLVQQKGNGYVFDVTRQTYLR